MKNYKIVLQNSAKEDTKEARKWYEKKQKGLGKRFLDDMKNTLKAVSRNPTSFAVRYRLLRLANFDTFPYAAHFFIDEVRVVVYVTAIVHASRHPDIAKER